MLKILTYSIFLSENFIYLTNVNCFRVLEEEIRSLRNEKEAILAEKEKEKKEIVVAKEKEKECLRKEMEKKMDVIEVDL